MIAIACDHGGFKLKLAIEKYFEQNRITYRDFGAYDEGSCDYADYAKEVALSVKNGQSDFGI